MLKKPHCSGFHVASMCFSKCSFLCCLNNLGLVYLRTRMESLWSYRCCWTTSPIIPSHCPCHLRLMGIRVQQHRASGWAFLHTRSPSYVWICFKSQEMNLGTTMSRIVLISAAIPWNSVTPTSPKSRCTIHPGLDNIFWHLR